jgi:hypothetical protein
VFLSINSAKLSWETNIVAPIVVAQVFDSYLEDASRTTSLVRDYHCKSMGYAAHLQDDCALPFGFTLQPFADHAHVPLSKAPEVRLAQLPRCSECGAYLNCFNGVDMIGFRCALCGTYSDWTQKEARRYASPHMRDRQTELHRQVFEVSCPDYDDEAVQEGQLPPRCTLADCLQSSGSESMPHT